MDPTEKTVTSLPLTDIWNSGKLLDSLRIRHLSEDDIALLIKAGPVQFVMANVGDPLCWVEPAAIEEFWETEVKYRVALPDEEISLDYFPDNYCYVASEWAPYEGGALILLEKCS